MADVEPAVYVLPLQSISLKVSFVFVSIPFLIFSNFRSIFNLVIFFIYITLYVIPRKVNPSVQIKLRSQQSFILLFLQAPIILILVFSALILYSWKYANSFKVVIQHQTEISLGSTNRIVSSLDWDI